MEVLGEYTSTDVKENTAHPSYAPSTDPRSQIHTYLESADSPPRSELNATIVHYDFKKNVGAALGAAAVALVLYCRLVFNVMIDVVSCHIKYTCNL
jgi:5-methylcytosine-specific restriction endonuclease McrA